MNSMQHDLALWVGGPLVVIFVGALTRYIWFAGTTLRKLSEKVLPHFDGPTPDQIRAGVPDNTIPARQERIEQSVVAVVEEQQKVRVALAAVRPSRPGWPYANGEA